MRYVIAVVMMLLAVAPAGWSQRAISARAGLIHYLEGRADIDGERVVQQTNRFPRLREGQTLTTGRRGRIEILLNPFTFLRVGENSSIRMISDDLTDTRVELVSGIAILDVMTLENDNAISITVNGAEVAIRKDGLYQFAVAALEPNLLRVYDGEARIAEAKVTKGRFIEIDTDPAPPAKFDRGETDALFAWNTRRARTIERANGTRFLRTRSSWLY